MTTKTVNARLKNKRGTTSYWNNAQGFIPLAGEIIIYTDYKTITETVDNETRTVNIPGIKIGDGLAYVQDLPFIEQDLRDQVTSHINNTDIHVTTLDKTFWNNKLNTNDDSEVLNGALIFNRN